MSNKSHTCNKAYLVRSVDSMRLVNASLHTHIKNLSIEIALNLMIAKSAKSVKWYEKF